MYIYISRMHNYTYFFIQTHNSEKGEKKQQCQYILQTIFLYKKWGFVFRDMCGYFSENQDPPKYHIQSWQVLLRLLSRFPAPLSFLPHLHTLSYDPELFRHL